MKKKILFSVALASLVLGSGIVSLNNEKENLKDFAYDTFNVTKGVSIKNARRTNQSVENSTIYAQVATKDGVDYLRFATAIRGDINSVSYNRTIVATGASKDKTITTVYKSISAKNSESAEALSVFYTENGSLTDLALSSTKDFYWACFTIAFETETYKESDLNISVSVNGNVVASRTTSLYRVKNYYEDPNVKLGTFLSKSNNNSVDTKLVSPSSGIKDGDYKIPRGAVSDGEYAYYPLNVMGSRTSKIVKCNFLTNSIVKESEVINLTSIDKGEWSQTAGNLFIYKDYIYQIMRDGSFEVFNKDLEKVINLENKLSLSIPSGTIYDVEYNAKLNKFVIATKGKKVYFATENGGKIIVDNTQHSISLADGFTFNDITSDDKYIYVIGGKDNVTQACIYVYDWNGNYVTKVITNAANEKFTSNVNIQGMLIHNNHYYISLSRYGNEGLLIYELLFKQTSSIESKYTFDEAVEYMNLANKSEEDIVVANYKQINEEVKETDYYSLRGSAMDDNYIYLPLTNNGALSMKVAKYDLATNKVVKYSDSFEINKTQEWDNASGNLFIANDIIYIVKKDGLLALDKELNQVENKLNIDFGEASGKLLSMQYNEELNKFAILDTSRNLYLVESGKSATKVTQLNISSNYRSIESISSTNKYIYSVAKKDGLAGAEINVLDWNGNVIRNKVKFSGSVESKWVSDTSYNVQNIIVKGSKTYILGLNFGGTKGAYIFETTFGF